jgi:hypothetical protein
MTNISEWTVRPGFTHRIALQIHVVVANLEPDAHQVDERDIVSYGESSIQISPLFVTYNLHASVYGGALYHQSHCDPQKSSCL